MRNINKIIIHCSATKPDQDINAAIIRSWHKAKKWSDIGYHFVIKLDGTVEAGRPLERPGAHVRGYNSDSLAICLIGGLDSKGKAKNTFSETQLNNLRLLIDGFKFQFSITEVKGHRDYSPDKNNDGKITSDEWLKECPCFDVGEWYGKTKTSNTNRKSEVEKQKKNGLDKLPSTVGNNSSSNTKDSKPSRNSRSKKSGNNSTND